MDKRINNKTKENITIGPFLSSKKIYLKGKIFCFGDGGAKRSRWRDNITTRSARTMFVRNTTRAERALIGLMLEVSSSKVY